MNKLSYEKLGSALDLHHNLLHAEKQAIASRDLNTVESILSQKDQSLELLLLAKSEFGTKFPPHIESRINEVISLQEMNTNEFRKLHIQDSNSLDSNKLTNPLHKRLRQAYSN